MTVEKKLYLVLEVDNALYIVVGVDVLAVRNFADNVLVGNDNFLNAVNDNAHLLAALKFEDDDTGPVVVRDLFHSEAFSDADNGDDLTAEVDNALYVVGYLRNDCYLFNADDLVDELDLNAVCFFADGEEKDLRSVSGKGLFLIGVINFIAHFIHLPLSYSGLYQSSRRLFIKCGPKCSIRIRRGYLQHRE